MDTKKNEAKGIDEITRIEAAQRLRKAADELADRNYAKGDAPTDGDILDMLLGCVAPGACAEKQTERECDLMLFERLALLIDPVEHEQLVEVTLIPTIIAWKDELGDSCETVECTFSVEDTEGLDIDNCVTFSGYTAEQLQSMIESGSDEDFEVVEVGEPYQVSCRPVR